MPARAPRAARGDDQRLRLLLLYGGPSSEHQVSCLSARSVIEATDRDQYELITVGIARDGRWTLTDGVIEPMPGEALPQVADDGPTVALIGTRAGPQLLRLDAAGHAEVVGPVDVAFPVLHGPFGEDGTVQGLCATVGLPFVGADVTASAIGIDKPAMKAIFAAHGLPQASYRSVHRDEWRQDPDGVRADLEKQLSYPWFAKPARQGSSIGITKVLTCDGLADALAAAFDHDDVALVEQGVEGARELEVGVLGNDRVEVTTAGEILPAHEFYDFEAKYLDDSELVIPADVPPEAADEIDRIARLAYRAIGCRGMARVDFFLTPHGDVLLNEINTIPGFTPASMFPRLWDAEGVPYPELITRLIDLALAARTRRTSEVDDGAREGAGDAVDGLDA